MSSVDIAIGVPFAGKDQRGKVLIYNGNARGLHSKPSQVLQGIWGSQTIPSGFGFSLRGDADIDKNDYPGKVLCLFPHEYLFPGNGPFSGKHIMQRHFSHKRWRSNLTWHRLSLVWFQSDFHKYLRQNKQFLYSQETWLERQDGFQSCLGHKAYQLCNPSFHWKPKVMWSPLTFSWL